MHKKYSLTLLEVVIALSLAALLLTALLHFFTQSQKYHARIHELKHQTLPVELMRQRLMHLFSRLSSNPQEGQENRKTLYTTSDHVLVFSCDYDIDPDPHFCASVEERLYLDSQGQITLSSSGIEGNARQEVFLEKVNSLSFLFFDHKQNKWITDWEKKNTLPPFFKMIWSTQKEPNTFQECVFFLSESDARIVYSNSRIP